MDKKVFTSTSANAKRVNALSDVSLDLECCVEMKEKIVQTGIIFDIGFTKTSHKQSLISIFLPIVIINV